MHSFFEFYLINQENEEGRSVGQVTFPFREGGDMFFFSPFLFCLMIEGGLEISLNHC